MVQWLLFRTKNKKSQKRIGMRDICPAAVDATAGSGCSSTGSCPAKVTQVTVFSTQPLLSLPRTQQQPQEGSGKHTQYQRQHESHLPTQMTS